MTLLYSMNPCGRTKMADIGREDKGLFDSCFTECEGLYKLQ